VNLSISYDSYILLIGSTYGYIKFCFRDWNSVYLKCIQNFKIIVYKREASSVS
jgi:hypothetical protein